jgi:predicted transcriptional regulator of viral defense system
MNVNEMVNKSYQPSDEDEERILAIMKEEVRANPFLVRERLDGEVRKEYVNNYLDNLRRAGWVEKVTRGLYEFKEDPREAENDG